MTCFWDTAEFASVIVKMTPFEQMMFGQMWNEELGHWVEYFAETADTMTLDDMESGIRGSVFDSLYDMVISKLDCEQVERFKCDVFMSLGGDCDNY
jgi:hypothetical protein